MSSTRDIEVTIRITGDIGIPDAQVIAAINRLLETPHWKIAEEAGVPEAALARVLPPNGRWKVVAK